MIFLKKEAYFFFILIQTSFSLQNSLFLNQTIYPGLIKLTKDSDLFYILVESRQNKTTDPLILWLNGGPGCSSLFGFFEENGPFRVKDDISLEINPYSWNNIANLIYLDQPIGTGYSRAGKLDDNEDKIAQDMYEFLIQFLQFYPQFQGRDFYITGESYAGQYIPSLGSYLLSQNNPQINFKGVAIGNGWVDPFYQFLSYGDYALQNKLIEQSVYQVVKQNLRRCQTYITLKSDISIQNMLCDLPYFEIVGTNMTSRFNVYNYKIPCDGMSCYDSKDLKIQKFVTKPDVQQLWGVQGRKWQSCVDDVYYALSQLQYRSSASQIASLLNANIQVLIYYGDLDFQCNYIGGEYWIQNLKWDKQQQFQQLKYQPYQVNGEIAGKIKVIDNLQFLIIHESGHMVPMDKPQISLEMINNFINN